MRSRFYGINIISGQLKLPTQGSGGGILIGGDVPIFRVSPGVGKFGSNMQFLSTKKLQFRDSALYISSKDDGHLDIDADGAIDLNCDSVLIPHLLKHEGDTDTSIRFTADQITMKAGNNDMFDLNATSLSFFGVTKQTKQAHIIDADGQLADITTKFNTLLADLEGYGLLATS